MQVLHWLKTFGHPIDVDPNVDLPVVIVRFGIPVFDAVILEFKAS